MRLSRAVLLSALTLASVNSARPSEPRIAHASVEHVTEGFLRWADTLPKDQRMVRMEMPAIDVYSHAGVLIYHGDDPDKNAAFLRAFPRSLVGVSAKVRRPTLKFIVELFPEYSRDEAELLDGKKYTIVAYTYPGWDRAKPQDEAILALSRRASAASVRILEVSLSQ